MTSISEVVPSVEKKRTNSLDFFRLVFAAMVILGHSAELVDGNLSRESYYSVFHNATLGAIAVEGFFILSGYLITQSWLHNPNVIAYLRKRVLRIYPGFLVACTISLVIVGQIGYGKPGYLQQVTFPQVVKSFLRLQPSFPSSFLGTHYPAINGPVWTIPYEFICYFLVIGMGLIGVFRGKRTLLLPLVAFVCIILSNFQVNIGPVNFLNRAMYRFGIFGHDFYRLFAYFLMGAAFYFYQKKLLEYQRWSGLCGAILVVCLFLNPVAEYARMTLGTFLLFVYGLRTYRWIERLPWKGDYSYGMYLYGWPIQKLLIMQFPTIQPYPLAFVAIPLSFAAGACSWFLVEKPLLKFK